MKKLISILILAAVLLSAGCTATTTEGATETQADVETTEAETETETEEIIVAPNEDAKLTCSYVNSFTKTDPNVFLDTEKYSYTVYMAKNETENAQIVISTEEDRSGLSVEISELKAASGAVLQGEVLREYYIDCGGTYFPDPIAPMNEQTEKFDIASGKSQAMLLSFTTEKDTEAGRYEGIVSVKCGDETLKQVRIAVNVWDITISDTFTSECVMGMNWGQIYRFDPQLGEDDYYRVYYEFLLDYGVNAYELPYDIRSAEGQAYMSDPRVRSFRVNYTDNVQRLQEYYSVLSSNEEWMKKAYFYPHDEPTTKEGLANMARKCELIREHCPGVRIVVPFFTNIAIEEGVDQIEYMSEHVDIWCPKTFAFTKRADSAKGKKMLYTKAQERNFEEFGQRMANEAAEGDDIWWYVCWEPGMPYLNMYVDMTGLQNRLLFWQQKQYNVTGFLYWQCNYWGRVENPWTNMATVGKHHETGELWLSESVFGDGSVIYPGSQVGVTGPCSSMRLESVRDGLEDFELFTMLEEKLGSDAVNGIIKQVSDNIIEFSSDEEAFVAARIELGNMLEEALKND